MYLLLPTRRHISLPTGSHLAIHAAHAFHPISCGKCGFRHSRHDALARIIADAAVHEAGYLSDLKTRLCSSSFRGTKVDLVLTAWDRVPPILAIDVTVSCPLLPWSPPTSPPPPSTPADYSHPVLLMRTRSTLRGAWIWAALSCPLFSRPSEEWATTQRPGWWIDDLFRASFVRERLAGGSGFDTAQRKQRLFHSLHATLSRSCECMITRLVLDPAPAHIPAPTATQHT